jgi:hypothetical protein
MQDKTLQQYRDLAGRLEALDLAMGNFDALVEYIVEANSSECSLATLEDLYGDLLEAFENNADALEQALSLLEEHGTAEDRSEFFEGWRRDSVLDTEVLGVFGSGAWLVTAVEFLFTYGGGTARAIWSGTDVLEVVVEWSQNRTNGYVTCAALAAEARDIEARVNRSTRKPSFHGVTR